MNRWKADPVAQFCLLLGQALKAELADRERLISPLLFALTILILFGFAFSGVDASQRLQVYLAQTFLTVFFALQVAFSRVFEPDHQDRVFDVLRTYPISYPSWFLARYVHVLLIGAAVAIPAMLFGNFLNQSNTQPLFSWVVLAIALLAMAGLAALGVLLSAMTSKAAARQMLYPIIYFPLSAPVLLAALQASLIYCQGGAITPTVRSLAYLLVGFDVIFFTLGILLFSEIVDDS